MATLKGQKQNLPPNYKNSIKMTAATYLLNLVSCLRFNFSKPGRKLIGRIFSVTIHDRRPSVKEAIKPVTMLMNLKKVKLIMLNNKI